MAKRQPTGDIIAVGYCRKSTNEERAEKSIADQKGRISGLHPDDRNRAYDITRWYVKDKGVPGWKRGAARPDFFRLVNELHETGATAILVDDMDRFSRANEMEVIHDVQELKEKHGIQFIHACNQGCVDIINDPHATMKIAMWAMASHEHCKRGSRRTSHSRLDAALRGDRSGGPIPFGLADDGTGKKLVHGDKGKLKIVRRIFKEFVDGCRSLTAIATDLNAEKIPGPDGKAWRVATLKVILKQPAYIGDLRYNDSPRGEFTRVDGDGDVVERRNCEGNKIFLTKGAFPVLAKSPVVPRPLFDRAQRRLAEIGGQRGKNKSMYPLSGLIFCGHCGQPLYGCQNGSGIVYRCTSPNTNGTCKPYQVREDRLLPYIMRALGEEIANLHALLSAPPEEIAVPRSARAEEHRAELEKERAKLTRRLEMARDSLMDAPDRDTRQHIAGRIKEMAAELERVEKDLTSEPTSKGYTNQELTALLEWYAELDAQAVSVPVPSQLIDAFTALHIDHQRDWDSEPGLTHVLIDARKANAMLRELGCRVTLRWETEQRGKRPRHNLVWGRFQLGQREVALPKYLLASTASRHAGIEARAIHPRR